MGALLVHITCGPEAPTRAALGMLVARAAVEEGHQVDVFLAGDAVQLMREHRRSCQVPWVRPGRATDRGIAPPSAAPRGGREATR